MNWVQIFNSNLSQKTPGSGADVEWYMDMLRKLVHYILGPSLFLQITPFDILTSLKEVSVQTFSDEDPQGCRTLGLFLHRRKAEISGPLRKVQMYVDTREKVTARYQVHMYVDTREKVTARYQSKD